MNRAAFDAFCGGMKGAAHVIQWGGSSVWKVGGKVFAIHADWGKHGEGIVLKPSEFLGEVWRGAPGVSPAPYLGRAGWLMIAPGAMGAAELGDLIRASHGLAAAKRTRKVGGGWGV